MSNQIKKVVSSEAGRAFVKALIKKHLEKHDFTDDVKEKCFKCLIGIHDDDKDDNTTEDGFIFKVIRAHEPKDADNKPRTKAKLNSIITEFKKFVYRVKDKYKCDVIGNGFNSYERYKGKNEPIFSIHGENGEKMELLRADYYKQLTGGYEANKQQIKDLRTAKALLTAEQKEHRQTTGELKQAQQTISQLRENNREFKSKYKALLNQKIKERQPAPPISNELEIIHSDKEEEQDEEEGDEESEEGDESKKERDEGEGEEQREGEDNEDNEGEGNEEGKQAIIEGEPDPPYLDEIEPCLFTPYIQRNSQHITKDDKSHHYII